MNIDEIVVLFAGTGLVGFIYWFFFGKKDQAFLTSNVVSITVSGGYKPSIIKVKRNQEITLNITRTDSNSCLEEIVFPDFKIKEYLPLNKSIKVRITPKVKGQFDFHCGMNMFQGKVVVE